MRDGIRVMWISRAERLTLAVVAAVALMGLAVLCWQRQHPPITVTGAPASVAQWDATLASARQVDINAADVAELERLPEIGPTLADRIVAYRVLHGSFRSPEELVQVKGIGPKKFATLSAYVTVSER